MAGLMDLFIKIGVEDEASEKISGITSSIGKGLKNAAKVGGAAIGASATAIGALGKQAVNAYADYEQLVGGVETLFKDSAGIVQEYAENAYKTAGLSANEYMETVTSFSASLLQSLDGDTARAANVSDMAITDMADNANKMGTSMEAIQNAYQGFAKQNYTMLDNLKLGYGGTKEEMERLLSDAEALSGVHYDISNLSDVYEAIHVVQTEMGITGTTAEEAASTISGSFGTLQGAWGNFIAGLGNSDADISELLKSVVDAGKTYLKNLMPVVRNVLKSLGEAVVEIAPILEEEIPPILESLLPALLEAAVGLIQSIANVLPDLLMIIVDQLPTIIPALIMAAVSIVSALVTQLPEILSAVWEGIKAAAVELWPVLEQAFSDLDEWFSQKFGEAWSAITGVFDGIGEWFSQKFTEAWDAITGVFAGWGEFFSGLWDDISTTFTELGTTLGDAIGGAVKTGVNAVLEWIEGTVNDAINLINSVIGFINNIPGVSLNPLDTVTFPRLAIGMDYVPYDNYPAYLHKGEAVLTASEADDWRRGDGGNGKVVNLNIYAQQLSQADMDYIVATVNRELA